MAVMEPEPFLAALRERGFDYCAGVPCSLIKGVIAALEAQSELPYIAATREDQALGIAAGAYLAGRRPVVLMQNSGLGVSLNALLSLHRIYKLPCLLLITWRGYEGKDAPEHVLMGPAMPAILDASGIPHRTLEPDGSEADILAALDWAADALANGSEPVALLCRKGALA